MNNGLHNSSKIGVCVCVVVVGWGWGLGIGTCVFIYVKFRQMSPSATLIKESPYDLDYLSEKTKSKMKVEPTAAAVCATNR